MRYLLLLAVGFFALTGCREALTGPDLPSPDPIINPVPTQGNLDPLYVKGPSELRTGREANYRAEPYFNPELDHFEWRVLGTGGAEVSITDPAYLGRLVKATGTEVGPILLTVRAFASDGRRLAYGERAITIDN